MTSFTYASLFAGIGGFESGLNAVGGECVFASEWDKFAAQSYEALYGYAPHGDITQIDAQDVPDHDVLTADFPCQAFSVAGLRKGFEDTRGTLFFEVARIAKVKQPKVLLLENVKGLVGHDKGRTLDTIVQTLNDIGYTVDFEVLNSKYFGVPQNRERIFIIAVRDDLVEQAEWSPVGNTVVPRGKRRIGAYEGVKTFNFDFPTNDEVATRLRDVLEAQVDEKYYLSDEKTAKLVAQLEEVDKIPGSVGHHPFSKKYEFKGYNTDISPTLIATDYKAPKTLLEEVVGLPIREATTKGYAVAAEGDAVNFQFPDSKTRRGRVGKGIANTLEASAINQGVVEYSRKTGIGDNRDTAICLSASDWRGLNRNQKQNAVLEEIRPVLTPDRMEKRQNGRRFKEDGEESFTLTSQDKHGVAIGNPPKYRIRKLTPLECWRLQGFTDAQHQRAVDAGISDSQRYKQAGNAVTVNVIKALGERLLPYLGVAGK